MATAPLRRLKRRIYWSATIVAIPVLFVAGLPDLQSSIAFVAMAVVLMGGWAYFRTPNIKIDGRRAGRPDADQSGRRFGARFAAWLRTVFVEAGNRITARASSR